MKIAFVIRLFNPEIGGVEGVARSLATGLAAKGHDVHVFTSERAECGIDGVTIHRVTGWQFSSIAKTLSFPYFAKKAIQQQGDFDIVHAFSRMAGADIYRLADPPQAAHLNRNYQGFKRVFAKLSLRNRTILGLEQKTYTDYQTKLVTNSYRTRRDLERYCAVEGSRVSVIRNGVNTERFHLGLRETHRDTILNELGIPNDARVLLFMGNDFRRKGLAQTVQVLETLQQRMPDKPLHLIVVGLERTPIFRKDVEERGLSSTVHFMGRCKNSERFYGAADVFILPTREDPFANTILESLACGVPVITTRTNGAGEILESELEGRVVASADDCDAMVAAARDLFNMPDLVAVRDACRNRATQYSWDQAVAHYEALYAEHLQQPTVTPPTNLNGIHYLDPALHDAFNQSESVFSAIMGLAGDSKRSIDRRETLRLEIDGQAYFLKKHCGVGWNEIIKNLSSLKRPIVSARTEWVGIQQLEALGISTLSPVGFGERGCNPAEIHSFLMTRELEGMVKLSMIHEQIDQLPVAQTALIRRSLIIAVAKLAKRFHEADCAHSDFYLCHFMVKDRDWSLFQEGDTLDLHLIDLHRMHRHRSLPLSKQVKEIGALLFSATHLQLTKAEQDLFIQNYQNSATNPQLWEKVCKRITHLVASKKRLLKKRPA
jgi:UDP-glucose:(heptosyl)LPS alpha-1,3-glucosyltransferase